MQKGDHEIGDNPWTPGENKGYLVKHFRHVFAENFNFDRDGRFLYPDFIDNIPPRPVGTDYQETSLAFIHKNVLFVTIDVLHQQSPLLRLGEDGSVAGHVTGDHLKWFDSILQAGQKNTQVKHIIVQGHFPVLYPVRKVKSSGIYMKKDGTNSKFWETMRRRGVDIYFAGEVRESWPGQIFCHLKQHCIIKYVCSAQKRTHRMSFY